MRIKHTLQGSVGFSDGAVEPDEGFGLGDFPGGSNVSSSFWSSG